MAQSGVQLEQKVLSCTICLHLLKDPVLIPCGHSFCMSCIKPHWDKEDEKKVYSCPQCRKCFIPRPGLKKNDMMKVLVEEVEKTGLRAAPADPCDAGPADVASDVCAGRKRKASESCMQCLVSDCGEDIQLHDESTVLKKHKLMEPSEELQENTCPQHHEVMKMFCRSEQRPFCHLCPWDEHIEHDTIPSAAERTERQRWLNSSQGKIRQGIQGREKDVELLEQEVEAINSSADKAVEHSDKMFSELIRLMEMRFADVKELIRSQQKAQVSRLKKPQEKLKQEIAKLKRKEAEIQKLSQTEDDNQFLHDYPPLSALRVSTYSSSIRIRPVNFFGDVKAAITEVKNKLSGILTEKWANILQPVSVLFIQPRPAPPPKPPPNPQPVLLLLPVKPQQLQITKPQQPLLITKPQQPLLITKPQQPLLITKPQQPLLITKPESEQPLLVPKPEQQPLLIPKPELEQPLLIPKPEQQPLLIPKPEPEQLLLAKSEPEQPPLSKINPNPPPKHLPQPKTEPEPGPELNS